jgi:uncharacterized protein YkwD
LTVPRPGGQGYPARSDGRKAQHTLRPDVGSSKSSAFKKNLLIAGLSLLLGIALGIGCWAWLFGGLDRKEASSIPHDQAAQAPRPPRQDVVVPQPPQVPEQAPQENPPAPENPNPLPPPAPPPEPAVQLSPEEQQLLDLVNQARAEEKLPPLKPHPKLVAVARAHAANMANQETLDDELDGKDTPRRVAEAGYAARKVVPNLLVDGNLDPAAAIGAWLEGVVARSNILDKFEETGIGIARNDKGEVYFIQVFATPEK